MKIVRILITTVIYLAFLLCSCAVAILALGAAFGIFWNRPDGSTPGDGFGIIIILVFYVPAACVLVVASPFLVSLLRFKQLAVRMLAGIISEAALLLAIASLIVFLVA
jgi:hypothetical protein